MRLTNDQYVIWLRTTRFAERYYRDAGGWWKVSARGRKFRATAEQVLNHLLPALAGVKGRLAVEVELRGPDRTLTGAGPIRPPRAPRPGARSSRSS